MNFLYRNQIYMVLKFITLLITEPPGMLIIIQRSQKFSLSFYVFNLSSPEGAFQMLTDFKKLQTLAQIKKIQLLGPSKLIRDFGIPGGKIGILGFHSVEIGILEIRCEIGILAPGTWDLILLKLGFWEFVPFKIRILGFLPWPYYFQFGLVVKKSSKTNQGSIFSAFGIMYIQYPQRKHSHFFMIYFGC